MEDRRDCDVDVKFEENARSDGVKIDLRSLTKEELTARVRERGEQAYRAGQIFGWLHSKCADGLEEMTNVPKGLREALERAFTCGLPREVRRQESKLDGTKKFLFELADGSRIESVFMKYRGWNSVCISSQVGCAMGCAFCASAIGGCQRDLSAGELLSQIYAIQRLTGERASRVVVMGSGEPLLNYVNLIGFIELLTDKDGQGLSRRNITVSTCGIVEGIDALAREGLGINLAISLHAATDAKRQKIMPIAKKYSLGELIRSCQDYFMSTKRQLTFEYALIDGFNNTEEDAEALSRLLKDMNCVVNLIPINPVRDKGFNEPGAGSVRRFKASLERKRLNVTIRRELGRDIDGACGQLRAKGGRQHQ